MRIYDVCVMMIYAFQSEYQESPNNNELRLFLSDLNPFLFYGEGSAVQAEYTEFKEAFDKYGTFEADGYDFVKKYIQEHCTASIRKVFEPITKEVWPEAWEEYKKRL